MTSWARRGASYARLRSVGGSGSARRSAASVEGRNQCEVSENDSRMGKTSRKSSRPLMLALCGRERVEREYVLVLESEKRGERHAPDGHRSAPSSRRARGA